MQVYFRLLFTASIPIISSIIFYFVLKNKYKESRPPFFVLVALGILFGIYSCLGTELGVSIGTAVINVRDVAPLCAGLIFGGPAGVIAGLIGGIERYLSPNAADYTRIACTTATILAGILSAFLRRVIFDDKKPTWIFGIAVGAIIEVFHMLMVFVTHATDIINAFPVVQACTGPMVGITAISLGITILTIDVIEHKTLFQKKEKITLTIELQKYLVLCIIFAFILTGTYAYFLQNRVSYERTYTTIKTNIDDIKNRIETSSEDSLIKTAKNISYQLSKIMDRASLQSSDLADLAETYNTSEINVIDERGIIKASNIPTYVGYDMKDNKESEEFMILITDPKIFQYSQDMRKDTLNEGRNEKYVGIKFKEGALQIGFNENQYHDAIDETVADLSNNWHIGEHGYAVIIDNDGKIVSNPNGYVGYGAMVINIDVNKLSDEEFARYEMIVSGKECFAMSYITEGFTVLGIVPKDEILLSRDISLYTVVFMEAIIFFIIFLFVYYITKRVVVNNIEKINISLGNISDGNLDTIVDVRSNKEFSSLSDDINKTVNTLKGYIDKEAKRIDSDLKFAYQIQRSVLPNVFPAFHGHDEFDIFAGTKPAKQVGGDFYDFFFGDDTHLVCLIADVSGKGIPAAMFMMNAKTIIKNLAMGGMPVGQVLTEANRTLAAENDAGMFVTVWIGSIDLRTGEMTYASAGHNPAIVVRDGKNPEMLASKPNLVLAAIGSAKYDEHKAKLNPKDVLYLYTDGVTEATDSNKELFGDDRLLETLRTVKGQSCYDVCKTVLASVDKFVGDAEQFDDITMLSFVMNYLLNKQE